MQIGVVGISYKNAAVEQREKFNFTTNKKLRAYKELKALGVSEIVILSTCNRAEIYFASSSIIEAKEIMDSYFDDMFGLDISKYFYFYKGKQALGHLFSVTCGLESLVLGEDQILGQVKSVHELAMECGGSSKLLNKIFRESITFAKYAKTEYKMSENPQSISSVAVKYISQKVGGLSGKNVLLMGVGKIGSLLLRYLSEHNEVNIFITKRAENNGHKYKRINQEYCGVKVIDFKQRYEYIKDMDVVFSATASPHVIVKADKLPVFDKQVVFMDIAVPRDVDIRVRNMPNVSYHDIDDLNSIVDEGEDRRRKAAESIRKEIEQEVKKTYAWISNTQVDDTIKKLNKMCESVYKDTWDMIEKKIDLNDKDQKNMRKILKSSINQVVRTPIKQLKKIGSDDDVESIKRAFEYLYDLEES